MDFLRIIRILIKPRDVWHAVKDDEDTFGHVLTHYTIPLAAIPAVFGFIGHVFVGMPSSFSTAVYRTPFGLAFVRMIVYYVLLVAGLYLEGIIINALAPSFRSKQDGTKAFKLAVYSFTPAFIAGVLNLFPVLGLLVFVLSLYSIYLLYTGLPVLMEVPEDKVIGYTILIVAVMIVVHVIIGIISSSILAPAWRP